MTNKVPTGGVRDPETGGQVPRPGEETTDADNRRNSDLAQARRSLERTITGSGDVLVDALTVGQVHVQRDAATVAVRQRRHLRGNLPDPQTRRGPVPGVADRTDLRVQV